MRQFFGMSRRGNLREAVSGLVMPQMLLLMSNERQFEEHVRELEALFPGVPSIGCIGMSYDTQVVEDGVGVVAFQVRSGTVPHPPAYRRDHLSQ